MNLNHAMMSNWIFASYHDWLPPVVEHLKKRLLEREYLHINKIVPGTWRTGNEENTAFNMSVYCI